MDVKSEMLLEQNLDKKKKMRTFKRQTDTVPAFLVKTYEILNVNKYFLLKNPQYEDIICWNDEGNAFIVKNVNEFSLKILPKYFKHSNFASFVR